MIYTAAILNLVLSLTVIDWIKRCDCHAFAPGSASPFPPPFSSSLPAVCRGHVGQIPSHSMIYERGVEL
jgi:hypothetical protein